MMIDDDDDDDDVKSDIESLATMSVMTAVTTTMLLRGFKCRKCRK